MPLKLTYFGKLFCSAFWAAIHKTPRWQLYIRMPKKKLEIDQLQWIVWKLWSYVWMKTIHTWNFSDLVLFIHKFFILYSLGITCKLKKELKNTVTKNSFQSFFIARTCCLEVSMFQLFCGLKHYVHLLVMYFEWIIQYCKYTYVMTRNSVRKKFTVVDIAKIEYTKKPPRTARLILW